MCCLFTVNCSCSSKGALECSNKGPLLRTLTHCTFCGRVSPSQNAICTLFTVKCSCSSKGALAGIKDPGPLEEAITRGDLSTAKKLLAITESETESGELTLVGINPLTQDAYQ